jgi:hypothetical protein
LHNVQGLNTASIEYARVVEVRHHTQQRVQAADFFWEFPCSPIAQSGKCELNNVWEAARRLSARASGSISISHDVTVGNESWLRPVGKPCNATRRRRDPSRMLAVLARGRGDKKAENPDSTFVGVTSLGSLVHRAFRVTSDYSQLSAQVIIQIPDLGAGCHRDKIRLKDSRGLRHQFEREVAVRTGTTPVN